MLDTNTPNAAAGTTINLRGYQSAYGKKYETYPHNFGDGYKVQTFYANLLPEDWVVETGDEFDVLADAEEAYPDHEIVVGFRVVCDLPGEEPFPKGCETLCKTVEEAIALHQAKIAAF